ncbi:PIN domain-containing protein [Streptomyces sp. NPDC058595]|uniref:PIN domain-containing protein n=1 Tax=Streptomyces sp. NPDC058595 TaxID=3346550 RepID=UPI003665181F
MIILDTCILEKFALDSTSSDLLKTINTSEVDVVAVPDTVMSELVSHRVVSQREKHEKAVEALKNYEGSSPWPIRVPAPSLNLDRLTQYWSEKYGEIVSVVHASEGALREAFRREAMLLPPCKQVEAGNKDHKIGGRDAAIWLTAVEYARGHPDETVVFVSANTGDFGDGPPYPYPMDEDLAGLSNFVHLTKFTEVISRFATPTHDVRADAALRVLSSKGAAHVIQREVRRELGVRQGHERVFPVEVTTSRTGNFNLDEVDGGDLETVMVRGFTRPRVKLSSVSDVTAHEIAGHIWCSATARWLISGLVLDRSWRDTHRSRGPQVFPAGTTWETRVLFSTTQPDLPLTVLRTWPAKAATPDDLADMPEFPTTAEAAAIADTGRDRILLGSATRGEAAVRRLLAEIGDTSMDIVLGRTRHVDATAPIDSFEDDEDDGPDEE